MSLNNAIITYLNATDFSALAYAPLGENAITQFGLGSAADAVQQQAAVTLKAAGWEDITAWAAANAGVSSGDLSNQFRVFVNSNTSSPEIVFAFKGSSSPSNWISDLDTTDQGFTQYQSIEAAALAVYAFLKGPN
jgi:hypothetical protein